MSTDTTKKIILYYLLYPVIILEPFCKPSTMFCVPLLHQNFVLNEQSFSTLY